MPSDRSGPRPATAGELRKLMLYSSVTILLGAIVSASIAREYYWAAQATSWSTTRGTVRKTDAHWEQKPGRWRRWVSAEVTYSYQVENRSYTSKGVGFGMYPPKSPEEVYERYPPGSAVTVHYRPGDPASSVLEAPPPPTGLLVALALGLGFTALGCAALLHFGRRYRAQRRGAS